MENVTTRVVTMKTINNSKDCLERKINGLYIMHTKAIYVDN